MKTLRYSNAVLTVIAVLLTLNLYVLLAGTPAGSALSAATEARAGDARGVGSQAERLQEIHQAMTDLNLSVEQINTTLTGGALRVKLEGAPAEQGE